MVKIKRRLVISFILLLIWGGVIFYMSSMESKESNNESKSLTGEIIEKVVDLANRVGLMDRRLSNTELNALINKLNYPIRKLAHITEYFILTVLLLLTFNGFGIRGNKMVLLSLLICFIYAITDEYHQVFVDGRSGQFSDVLVDMIGGVIACCLVFIRRFIKRRVS